MEVVAWYRSGVTNVINILSLPGVSRWIAPHGRGSSRVLGNVKWCMMCVGEVGRESMWSCFIMTSCHLAHVCVDGGLLL